MSTIHTYQVPGWEETIGQGLVNLFFAIVDEGIVTAPGDTPSNGEFRQRIANAETFSIRWQPVPWFEGGSDNQAAAFGQLQLVNYDGLYNDLLKFDLRDVPIVIKLIPATLLTTGTQMRDAMTVCTGIIDSIVQQQQDMITITIKDTLARLDKVLPCRFNPPFAASGAANVMVPLAFGANRNGYLLLIDEPNRIFQMHDGNIPNVTSVTDKAAPLDRNASPPQYVPALSGSAVQLDTMPIGKVAWEGSSYGTQSVIPGIADVLAGAGQFTGTWTGSPAVPPGWTWTNNAGSSIVELNNPPYPFGTSAGAQLVSTTAFYPGGALFGDVLTFPSTLLGGVSYRVNFSLYNVQQYEPYFLNGMVGGVMVSTALSGNAEDYISGYAHPLTTPAFNQQNFSIEFTVPSGATRDLNFLVVPSAGNGLGVANGNVTATIFNVTLERLGQYVSLPLTALPLQNYYTEILVLRAGESASIFNSAEAQALGSRDDGTPIPFAASFTQPPKILDALRLPVKPLNGVIFTDNLGVIRTRKTIDPSDPDNHSVITANFTADNVERVISVVQDMAPTLTTLFGARPNQQVFGAADFVSDQAIVPQDVKTRYMRKSQFWVSASVTPNGMYASAITAPIFDTALDLASDVQTLGDAIVKIFSPQIYPDGSSTSGQAQLVTFLAHFDDPSAVGVNTTCALTDLIYGKMVTLTFPNPNGTPWFVNVFGSIEAWEPLPFAQKVKLTIRVKLA